MDLVASCKDKLAHFRMKELKEVLTQLGLSKQGKKQDLIDRILAILVDERVSVVWAKKNAVGKEDVRNLVDDIYRKMQVSGAIDLASKDPDVLEISNSKVRGDIENPLQSDKTVRCLCGSALEMESMIKCKDLSCQVWQHIGCVLIPEKSMEGNLPVPDLFYCEICRLSRADPFWDAIAHPLYPLKLATTNIPTDGSNPVQSLEKTFHLTSAYKDLLLKQECDVQVWCMLLNDKVPFRMHWPQYADLQVNGVPVRAINRPGSQLLGANGRDDGPIVTPFTKDGINTILLTGCDSRIFCLGVRIVKRRTIPQILNLIPKESDGKCFEDALTRVCRVGGATATDNADSDSDLEVVSDSFAVNLRCPMSGSRMKVAGRFKPCDHMGCFDLEVFVELNQRSRKWQCPICLKNYSLENIIIDPYFNRITSKMRHCSEDITEIEIKSDGSWRVKTKNEAERREIGELAHWHYPDGTLYISNGRELDSEMKMTTQIKKEGVSGHIDEVQKHGMWKNHNGYWEVSKPEYVNIYSSGNRMQDMFENHEDKVISMSSSTIGSLDGDDLSVNKDGGVNYFTSNGFDVDSMPLNVDPNNRFSDRNISAPVGGAEVIVLDDSDDDNDILISTGSIYKNNQKDVAEADFSLPPSGIAVPYIEDPSLGTGGNSRLGLFNVNDDEFEMLHLSQLPPEIQGGSGFQLFRSDVSDTLVDLQHDPIDFPVSTNGYTLAPNSLMGSSSFAPDAPVGRSGTGMNDGLVDNPLAFGGDDPSLQIFLPTMPSDASVQSHMMDQADVSNSVHSKDWFSLSLGSGSTGGLGGDTVPASGLSERQHVLTRECAMDSLADTDSLFLGMNDGRSEKTSRQRSDGPFSFPRQKRSEQETFHGMIQ